MKENKNNLIYYWAILINPIALLIFYKCIKTLILDILTFIQMRK